MYNNKPYNKESSKEEITVLKKKVVKSMLSTKILQHQEGQEI